MVYSIVDLAVGVSCAFSAKFPYRPVVAVLAVEPFDEFIEGVAVCALRVGAAGSGGGDD